MQGAATQMAGNLKSALAQPERGFCHPTNKQSYCPAACSVNTGSGLTRILKLMRSPFASVIAPSVLALFLISGGVAAHAQQVRIPLPKKSKYTPVQQLNRDGVAALKKHDIDKAKRYFYKAYLIDPNDPFTLNNLGYVAELEGDGDRAQRYYDQAEANTSDALVDRSTEPQDIGKPVDKIAGRTADGPMKVNQLNSQ